MTMHSMREIPPMRGLNSCDHWSVDVWLHYASGAKVLGAFSLLGWPSMEHPWKWDAYDKLWRACRHDDQQPIGWTEKDAP